MSLTQSGPLLGAEQRSSSPGSQWCVRAWEIPEQARSSVGNGKAELDAGWATTDADYIQQDM